MRFDRQFSRFQTVVMVAVFDHFRMQRFLRQLGGIFIQNGHALRPSGHADCQNEEQFRRHIVQESGLVFSCKGAMSRPAFSVLRNPRKRAFPFRSPCGRSAKDGMMGAPSFPLLGHGTWERNSVPDSLSHERTVRASKRPLRGFSGRLWSGPFRKSAERCTHATSLPMSRPKIDQIFLGTIGFAEANRLFAAAPGLASRTERQGKQSQKRLAGTSEGTRPPPVGPFRRAPLQKESGLEPWGHDGPCCQSSTLADAVRTASIQSYPSPTPNLTTHRCFSATDRGEGNWNGRKTGLAPMGSTGRKPLPEVGQIHGNGADLSGFCLSRREESAGDFRSVATATKHGRLPQLRKMQRRSAVGSVNRPGRWRRGRLGRCLRPGPAVRDRFRRNPIRRYRGRR